MSRANAIYQDRKWLLRGRFDGIGAQFNDELARAIAAETGVQVVSGLYDDTVGDAPLDTYASIMRWDVDQVVAALGGA